jgi:hypothetical protein
VNCSYTALELVVKNVKALTSHQVHNTTLPLAPKDIKAIINWEWSDGESPEKIEKARIETCNMDHLISVAIPLGLTGAYVSGTMDNLICLAGSGTEEDDPIIQFEPPPRGFQALFTLSTAEWALKQRALARGRYHDPEIRPVSRFPMRFGMRGESSWTTLTAKMLT